jgi:pimeloyl-ACP methyl ester carboxylesterase
MRLPKLANDRLDRRRFLGAAAMTIAAGRFGVAPPPEGVERLPAAPVEPKKSRLDVKQVEAGLLNIGYAEFGPPDGAVVVLLHGWPYDIHSYADVGPLLAERGYRVIVPFLRGYGSTRFLADSTCRNGQQSVFALDAIRLMDALHIKRAVVGGFDWGSRTAAIMAALWPDRVKALALVSGYLIVNLAANEQPLTPQGELGWWYQYYFATERGRAGYTKYRYDFNKLIWQNASPLWAFDGATFDRTAKSFDNPDHVAVVIHNYRWRLGLAKSEARYDELEGTLARSPSIGVPTITIASDFDGAAADGAAYAKRFSGKYSHRVLKGIGHNVPQEAPRAFADAIVDVDRYDVRAAQD